MPPRPSTKRTHEPRGETILTERFNKRNVPANQSKKRQEQSIQDPPTNPRFSNLSTYRNLRYKNHG